jgi:uncharacterized protein (DUF488 family)
VARLATIGVHGWTVEAFLEALRGAGVTRVVDVRQRRGVRGSEYAWANAQRLQAALAAAGLEYVHAPELAPTTELRELQYAADDAAGVGKRSRTELAAAYVERYEREILGQVEPDALAELLPERGVAALHCVERDAEACHRSLVAARMAAELGTEVVHLRP